MSIINSDLIYDIKAKKRILLLCLLTKFRLTELICFLILKTRNLTFQLIYL